MSNNSMSVTNAQPRRIESFQICENGQTLRFNVRPGTDDVNIIHEIAYANQYYGESRRLLEAGSVLIDVGAHIGSFSIFAAAWGARVFALEPVPDNFALLTENIRLNGMEAHVTPLNEALWSAAGERTMRVADDSTGGSGFWYNKETSPQIQARCMRLDELMEAEGIAQCDLLKLDCEGSEFEILSTLTVASWQRIHALVLEYHLWAGYTLDQLCDLLWAHGFLVMSKSFAVPAYGSVLALRPPDAMPPLRLTDTTDADSPLTRLPIVGPLWRVMRRPAHQLVLYYLNQFIGQYNKQQRRTQMYLRLLAQQASRTTEHQG